MRRSVLCLLLVATVPARAEAPGPLRARRFAVATGDLLASEAGASMLRAGGNAADAAVAAAFALGVVNPWNSGLGGGGFALVHGADGAATFLDFREEAPAAATADLFVRNGRADPALSRRGGLAVGVPGEVAGLAEISRRYGRLGLAKAAQPAIRLAERGFPARPALAASFPDGRPAADAGIARVFFPGGVLLASGAEARNPALAATLRAIAAHGAAAFYRGRVARAIVRAVRESGGILTEADLAAYRVRDPSPLRTTYRGYDLSTAPLPSSGGFALAEALAMLEPRDLRRFAPGSAEALHLVAAALQPAFADRATALGDTASARDAVRRLLDPARLRLRAARIDPDRALPASAWGDPAEGPRDAGTAHLSVVDAEGMAVALTTTVNLDFGAHVTAGDTGVVLNDQMDDFTAEPGVPNAFGLLQSAENAVAPGRRPLSSMAPTIVSSGGRATIVVGAAGGPRIVSAILQVIVGILDFDLDPAAALALPRVHHQWMPDELRLETSAPAELCRALSARGHRILPIHEVGVAQVLVVRESIGRREIEAASDPRGDAAPAPAGE